MAIGHNLRKGELTIAFYRQVHVLTFWLFAYNP